LNGLLAIESIDFGEWRFGVGNRAATPAVAQVDGVFTKTLHFRQRLGIRPSYASSG